MILESENNENLPTQSENRSGKNNCWRGLLKCFKKSSDDVDVLVEEQGHPVQIIPRESNIENVPEGDDDEDQQVAFEKFPSFSLNLIHPSLISLNKSPSVIIWNLLKTPDGKEICGIFDGILNKDFPISVKKVPLSSSLVEDEVNLVSKLANHENIIRFLFPIVSPTVNPEYCFLVTDSYKISLKFFMDSITYKLQVPTKEILKQLTNVADFLHQRKIIYMNFNPENVHTVTRNGKWKIVLTNFERSIEMNRQGQTTAKVDNGYKGVSGYIAPETKGNKKANFSTDIFSLGCLFYNILTAGEKLPQIYDQKQGWQFIRTLKKNQLQAKTTDDVLCNILIKDMTNLFNPKKRPIAAVIKENPYFWKTHKFSELILQVSKRLECQEEAKFKEKLEDGKEVVFGSNWKDKMELGVYNEVTRRRKYDPTSMCELVTAIRNQFAHNCAPILVASMGCNEKFKNYWTGKFPYLIPHLCRVIKTSEV